MKVWLPKSRWELLHGMSSNCHTSLQWHVLQADVPGVQFVDLDTRPQPEHHQQVAVRGYAIKVYAIYSSAFQEVVFLDADCMPLRDPEILFSTHEYRQVFVA